MRRLLITITIVSSLLALAAASASAETLSPWWHVTSASHPSYLAPGGQGVIVVTAANLGDAPADPATGGPVVIDDELPPGLEAVGIEAAVAESLSAFGSSAHLLECSLGSLACTYTGKYPGIGFPRRYPSMLPPYEQIQMRIMVKVTEPAVANGKDNEASVSGGGAPAATGRQRLVVSGAPVPFGVSSYELRLEEAGGALDTQAGSHPFQVTTAFTLNETVESFPDGSSASEGRPAAAMKDLHFKLPPGLVGNPTAIPRCTLASFLHPAGNGTILPDCSPQTVVGVDRVQIGLYEDAGNGEAKDNVFWFTEPIYNLEPSPGEPARFGFVVHAEAPVYLDTAVRTGGDYGVSVNVVNVSHVVEFLGSETTFWGVPGDAPHNASRGLECLEVAHVDAYGGNVERLSCPGFEELSPPPLLSLPTSCGGPLQTTMEADPWVEPHDLVSPQNTEPMHALDGCNRLPFAPQIRVSPDSQQASKPTGLTVSRSIRRAAMGWKHARMLSSALKPCRAWTGLANSRPIRA
jgi:hypothetical protein